MNNIYFRYKKKIKQKNIMLVCIIFVLKNNEEKDRIRLEK